MYFYNYCYFILLPINVLLLLLFSTASPRDYVRQSVTLRFSACDTQQCVSVVIVDDSVDEPDESFSITLRRSSTLSQRITLKPTAGVVTIMDNQST